MAYGYAGQVAARRPEQRVKASDVRAVQFGKPPFGRRGYDEIEVDDFLRKVTDALAQSRGVPPLDPEEVHQVAFRKPRLGSRGYDEDEVDAFLDLVEAELRWRSSPEGQAEMAGPAGGGGIGGGGGAGSGYAPPAGMVGLSGGPGAVAPAGPAVRAVTVALLADRGRMLVTEMADPTTGRTAYRPPGGEIAFGERGHEAVRRTMREEFGVQLTEVRPMATLESIHRFAGRDAHELVLVYEVATADPQVWSQPRLRSRRGDVTAIWAPVDMFRRNEAQLLPDGLLPLLG
jgi:DivIVA domain-containing protein